MGQTEIQEAYNGPNKFGPQKSLRSWRRLIRSTYQNLTPEFTMGGKWKNTTESVNEDRTEGHKRGKWEEGARDVMDTFEFDVLLSKILSLQL